MTILCNSSDPTLLQNELDFNFHKIAEWFEKNKLTLNIKKTKLMIFGTNPILPKFSNISLSYNGTTIDRVDSFRYLGVVFDPRLTWSEHINKLSCNISKRIGVIRRVKYYLPPKTLMMLGNALIMPLFDYCSCVWSNCNANLSNSLQVLLNRLGRILLSADIKTPIKDILSSLGWCKLTDKWQEQLLLMIFKSLKGHAPLYLSELFTFNDCLHSQCTRSQSNNTLIEPAWNNMQGKRTFLYRSTKEWNKLPNDIKISFKYMTIPEFKNAISNPP